MFNKLIREKQVLVVDGDGRYNACTEQILKNRLHDLIRNNMRFRGIQIFHYAGIQYTSRWNSYPLKYINALINCSAAISTSNTYLTLNNNEYHELQTDSSEVLGIGLSIMFMCRWYKLNINRIERIQGTGKRCDYRFPYNGDVVVFESKGRSRHNDIKSALRDCIIKKTNYTANTMYSTILHLPRDGSATTLYLYDPPTNGNIVPLDENYLVVKHYAKMTELAGLTVLAEKLRARIKSFEQRREWDISPIEFGNVSKIGTSIQIGDNNQFWTRNDFRSINHQNNDVYIRYALHERVIDLLESWDIGELLKFNMEERIVNEKISVASDGSLFYLGNELIK